MSKQTVVLLVVLVFVISACTAVETPYEAMRRLATRQVGVSTPTPGLPPGPGEEPVPTPTLPLPGQASPTPPLPGEGEEVEADKPTEMPPPADAVVIAASNVNLRSGPGTAYYILGTVKPGDTLAVLGRNAAASWFKVRTAEELEAWVWEELIELNIDVEDVEIASAPPIPDDAGTSAPADTGSDQPTESPAQSGQPLQLSYGIVRAWDDPAANQGYHEIYIDARGGAGGYRYFRDGEEFAGPAFVATAVSCSDFFATNIRVEDSAGASAEVLVTFRPFCPTPMHCEDCPLWSP